MLHNSHGIEFFSETNPQAMWDVWRNLFMEVADKHATRKIYKRNCMKNIAIQENNATAWERYKQARNDVNNTIKVHLTPKPFFR